mmetsp:Transcript_39558/g.61709  ORF Transcript_39558/g.61709 Transcript_39558/m.61709 type:complete len:220 (+) Transcript_39558:1006-1665(+)
MKSELEAKNLVSTQQLPNHETPSTDPATEANNSHPLSMFGQLNLLSGGAPANEAPEEGILEVRESAMDDATIDAMAEGHAVVAVVEATNVPSDDLAGLSGYFCKIRDRFKTTTTSVVRGSLNPRFEKAVLVPVLSSEDTVTVELMEEAFMGRPQRLIGGLRLSAQNMKQDGNRSTDIYDIFKMNEAGDFQLCMGSANSKPCQLKISTEYLPKTTQQVFL